MTRFLVVTTSVHATAAAADYLEDRLDPSADEVAVIGFAPPGAPDRDAADAVNVARSRLAAAAPTTDTLADDSIDAVAAAIDERDPDEVLVGASPGAPDASGPTETVRELLARADRPVVVLPVVVD